MACLRPHIKQSLKLTRGLFLSCNTKIPIKQTPLHPHKQTPYNKHPNKQTPQIISNKQTNTQNPHQTDTQSNHQQTYCFNSKSVQHVHNILSSYVTGCPFSVWTPAEAGYRWINHTHTSLVKGMNDQPTFQYHVTHPWQKWRSKWVGVLSKQYYIYLVSSNTMCVSTCQVEFLLRELSFYTPIRVQVLSIACHLLRCL